MAKKHKKPKAQDDLSYYETTGSAGATLEDASAINALSSDAVDNNILSKKLPPSYENSADTAPPNATSIGHG